MDAVFCFCDFVALQRIELMAANSILPRGHLWCFLLCLWLWLCLWLLRGQLAGTLFAVAVVQIKPQLERLLNLPLDALTKEVKLCQDLMTLFIE